MVSRRSRVWADTRFASVALNDGAQVVNDLRGAIVVPDVYTCVRLIVDFEVGVTSLQEAEFSQIIDLGIGVTSFEAFTAGVVPDPKATADYPRDGWLYVASKLVEQSVPTGATPVAMYRKNAVFQVDLRAGRKVDRGVLYSILENTAMTGTATNLLVTGRIRALFLT